MTDTAPGRRVGLPLRIALAALAAVFVMGCVWSFTEQTGFAEWKQFRIPQLLPLVIDGLAVSLAAVAWAASLDGRPAVLARLGTAVAVAASATSNGTFAWERSGGDPVTVAIAAAVPLASNLAFEALLAELRRQVLRRRGLPTPVAVPYPRLVRVVLAPWATFVTWRRLVLQATDLAPLFAAASTAANTPPAETSAPELAKHTARTPARTPARNAAGTPPQPRRNARHVAGPTPPETPPTGGTTAPPEKLTARQRETARKVAAWRAKHPDLSKPDLAKRSRIALRTIERYDTQPLALPAADSVQPANGKAPSLSGGTR